MGKKENLIRVKTQSCNSLVEFIRGLLNDNNDENNENVILLSKSYFNLYFLSNLLEKDFEFLKE